MQQRTRLLLGLASVGLVGLASFPALAYRGDYTKAGPMYSAERHEQMQKAFETGDYNLWKSLMEGRGRITEIINEGNFAKFAEAHRLALEGKSEEAAKIRAELGLNKRDGRGNGSGCCAGTGQRNGQGRGGGMMGRN